MSLVFDALRQHGTRPTQAPTRLGSVVTPDRRLWRWVFVAGLVCSAIAGMFLWEHFNAAERMAPRASAAALSSPEAPVEPALPVEPSAPAVSSAPQDIVVVDIALPTPTPPQEQAQPQAQAQTPATPSGSRLPGDALARLAETASVSAVATVGEPEVVAIGDPEVALPAPAPDVPPVAVDIAPSVEVNPAELFTAFNAALAAGQLQQAEEVIERARLALGDSHLIVARMQGYYCMRADCPAQARQAYSTILSRLPRDREAGYNLAVLDWQVGRQTEALRRVRALLSQHPEDEALRALQRQMGTR